MSKVKKRPRDTNVLAKSIVDIATGEIEDREPTPEEEGKDPAAVSLGRRGGRIIGNVGVLPMSDGLRLIYRARRNGHFVS